MSSVSKVMFAVPSKLTPLIFLAVASAVAVAALPVVLPDEPLTSPIIFATRVATP